MTGWPRVAWLWIMLSVLLPAISTAQEPVRLDTMRVRVASRAGENAKASTRSVEVIGADEIARRAGHDLSDILAASLGVDVFRRSPAQADLAIRGSSFNQIVILVDGVRVSDVQSGHYNLDLAVPVASIDRIEILRGGGSALYGADAIGGVVNVVTKRSMTRPASKIAAHGGTFGTVGADVAMSAAAAATSLFFTTDARRSDGHRAGTDYRAVQSRLAVSRRAFDGSLTADAGIGVRNFGAADFYGAYPSYEDTRSSTVSVGFERDVGQDWQLHAVADARRHSDLYTLIKTNPAAYQNRHVSWQKGGRLVATGQVDRVGTAIGVEGLDASLVSFRLGDRSEQRGALFSEMSVGGPATATAMLTARGDWSSRTGGFFSPGAAVAVPVSSLVKLRASANRGYRAPTWTETYYTDPANVANPDLRSETFVMAEIGVRATPSWGAVDAAIFSRRGDQLIDWTKPAGAPATTQWRSTNLESAIFRGAELEASIASLLGLEWRLRASGLTFQSDSAELLVGKYALSPITESASIEVTSRSWLGTRLTANTLRARRARESEYWRSDLRATRTFGRVGLRFDALNITNATYRDAAAKPVAGRILTVGVEIER